MSKEIFDKDCELNEAVFIAGTCGVGKTHRIRECEVFDKDCVLHEIYQRGTNRCFVQRKLYEIYYKPDGVSLEKSKLHLLNEDRSIIHLWTLNDHNEAIKLLKICQSNMKEFKANLPTMKFHIRTYTISELVLKNIRNHYKQIIDYYEATGFLEELTTCI